MADKVHWKTAQKLAKEAEQTTDPEIVELEAKVAKLEKALARPYHIFNARAELVAHAPNEEEANEILAGYPNGFKKLI